MMQTRVLLLALLACASTVHGQETLNVGDAELRYELRGAGPVVVLVHGWSQDLEIWDDQVAALTPRYRVLRYDRRGYGRSTGHSDPTADPDDLRILLDSLGIARATVLGLSGGAQTALNFGVAFPDRVEALVLYGLGPPRGFGPPGSGPRETFRRIAREHGLDSLGKLVMAHPLAWRPPNRPDLEARYWKSWARYEGRDLLDPGPESGRVKRAHLRDLPGIAVPTLLVHGDHEMPLLISVADSLVRMIPNATRVVITDGGHGAHFAQPRQFNDAVLRFLDDVVYRRDPR